MAQVEKRAAVLPSTFEWEYAPAPESRDVVQIRERYGLFIGGQEVEPSTSEWFASISPSTEEPLFEVAQAGEADVALAVDTARDAFENRWSELAIFQAGPPATEGPLTNGAGPVSGEE